MSRGGRWRAWAAGALVIVLGGCAQPERHFLDDGDQAEQAAQRPITVRERVETEWTRAVDVPPVKDGALVLSLEQAAVLALGHNRDLVVRQYAPVRAGAFEQVERGAFDPEAFAELSYDQERSQVSSGSSGRQYQQETSTREARAGLRQELPTGTSLEAVVEQYRDTSSRAPTQEQTRLGLSLTQQLLRGLGPAVNLVGVRQAQLETQASLYELRGYTEALLANAEEAYWNYVLANREIAIYQRSLEVARQGLAEVEERIGVGLLPEIEAAAVRAEVARREQGLIEAQAALEAARLRLLRLLGGNLAGGMALDVKATSAPELKPVPLDDVDQRLALAQKQRPELAEARLRLDQNRLETVATRDGLLPKLEFFTELGKSGYGRDSGAATRDMDGGHYDLSVGLSLSQYLSNRSAKGRDLAALLDERQAQAAVDNLAQQVEMEVRLAVSEAQRALRQITASQATLRFQEETLRAERERFLVGTSTSLLVAQAQRDLLEASINEVKAVVGYRVALIRVYLAEGSLLERRGVSLSQ